MSDSDEAAKVGIEQIEDIETCRQALAEQKEKAEQYLASWQRCQADFANYKKRSEQDKRDIAECASGALICSLLPVMDDLERAFASMPAELDESNWTEGIRLIYNKLRAILEAQGLACIEARGGDFDPRLHEAVMQQEGEEGMVIEETQKGYKFKERVIRPSLVVVGKGGEKRKQGRRNNKENQKWQEQ